MLLLVAHYSIRGLPGRKRQKMKTQRQALPSLALAITKTADDKAGTAALARARTEAEALTERALAQVQLWKAADGKADAAAADVARSVYAFVHGDDYAEVLGIPLESTFNDDGSVKATGLDLIWGIPDGTIRDLRDLGGVIARCDALGLKAPTKLQSARKLCSKLPKDDAGKSFRGERRFTNDETSERLRTFDALRGKFKTATETRLVKEVLDASDNRLGRTDDNASSPTGDLTKALDAVVKALAKLPADDKAKADAKAAFTARGLPMTPLQMSKAISWAKADGAKK